ncbi:hypothetical protein [Bifidobacterium gallicum]|nr:hypothetical protein [Bifidobacterium gallicum]EFA22729.1 hypothetical protein BIFGAL_03761 [Bifidobacterium gallicum DSM 20093 = LMG 11596]
MVVAVPVETFQGAGYACALVVPLRQFRPGALLSKEFQRQCATVHAVSLAELIND